MKLKKLDYRHLLTLGGLLAIFSGFFYLKYRSMDFFITFVIGYLLIQGALYLRARSKIDKQRAFRELPKQYSEKQKER